MRCCLAIVAGVLLWSSVSNVTVGAEAFVWWEGEAAKAHNFSNKEFSVSWLPRRDGLSGGDWLNNGGPRGAEEIFARYEIEVPRAGEYNFWARKFWKHGPFRWRFGEQPWRECGHDIALTDSFEFQTHICANWVNLGQVSLSAGRQSFELRLLAKEGEDATAAFDCFLLTTGFFLPRGKLKPGEKAGHAAPGWWAFEPPADRFRKDARLDLRGLNETVAGAHGFVKRDGEQFRLGNGQPVRFWGVNCGPDIVRLDRQQVDYLAARLAKTGVNIVRIHGPIYHRTDPSRVDLDYLDRLFYFVAALKRQGIYTALSFYFPLWIEPHPFAQIYFDPGLQALHRQWARALLTTDNPHTGRPLAAEPAIALIELVNEDSLFFWTFAQEKIPAAKWAALDKQYAKWLATNVPAAPPAKLLEAWHMTGPGLAKAGEDRRRQVGHQIRFLAGIQREFYAETKRFLREDLGAQSLVVAGNWKTADDDRLDAIERWTYAAGDVLDRHHYFGGKHTGPHADYAVSIGDVFADRAAVREPLATPFAAPLYAGHPNIISESGWTMPNRYRADNTFLCSALGALHGVAGFFFFAVNSAFWADTPQKFPVSVPSVLGQFPAAALQYRRGDVTPAAFKKPSLPAVPDDFASASAPQRPPVPLNSDPVNWDAARGLITVNTPRSVGACGFLAQAGAIRLGPVTIESGNEYAAIHIISLDDAPLSEAKRILVQAFTEERPYGWQVDAAGKILDLGQPPLNVRNITATVTVTGTGAFKATALDEHGYARAPIIITRGANGAKLTLPPDALYTVLERQ